MRSLVFLALLVGLTSPPSAQTVRDSVRMELSIYTFRNDYVIRDTPRTACGAGIVATWPNVLQDLLGGPDRTYGYHDYSLVATEGMYVPRGYGEADAPDGSLAHNPQLGGSGDGPRPVDCGRFVASAQYRLNGGPGPLNARPFRVTDWYATFSIPSGTPIALFEWEAAEGLALDFDASFESEQSREVDATAPAGKRPVASYAWDFGDGGTGSGARPTHTYDEAGEYTVRLTVTDDDGEEASRSETVTVHAAHLTVQVEAATDEVVKGDTIAVRATLTNSGSEAVFGVRAERSFTRVTRIPDDLYHPNGQVAYLDVEPAALADGEEDHVFRARLDPGESVEVTRDYIVTRAGSFRIYGETSFAPADLFVDWTGLAQVEAETPEADTVEVRQPCVDADPACASTLVTYPEADLAVRTFVLGDTERMETASVRSGLVVGPSPRVPVSNGRPTRFADHRFRLDGQNRCRSGCIDVEVTATDADSGEPLAGLEIELSHPAIAGPTVVTPGQGGGFLCDLAQDTCGQTITLTADADGRVEGYLAVPGVIGDAEVVLTVRPAADQPDEHDGMIGEAEHTIAILPNVVAEGPIPVNGEQARDLGGAAAIRVGFRRADLPNTLCSALKKPYNKVAKTKIPWAGRPPKALMDDLCKHVDAAGLGRVLDLAQMAAQVPQMAWFFDSTRLPDLGLAETRFVKTPPFFEVSSQFVDELSAAIEGRLDAEGDMAPGAAPFSIHEVSYLHVDGSAGYPVKTSALYFRLWDHTALVTRDYQAGLWLVERHDRSVLPTTTADDLGPGDTALSTPASGEGRRPAVRLLAAADSIPRPDSLYAGVLLTLSPDDDDRAETVRVLSATGTVAGGQTAELATALRNAHPAGSPLLIVGAVEDLEVPVPFALTPADTVATDGTVRLSWGAFQPVAAVDVEVATDDAFADVVAARTVEGAALTDGALVLTTAGDGLVIGPAYFWRARTRDRSGESAWSDTTRFVLRAPGVAGEAAPEALPEALVLTVHPNPSASRATVTVAAPTAGRARVVLFDALGRRVAVLADGVQPAGRHTLRLDVGGLPAGVYVLRVEVAGQAASRSLTVVR